MTVEYDIGDRPTLIAQFTNEAGTAADPTAITFTLKAPDGTLTTATQSAATNPAVGTWKWPIPAAFDQSGVWWFRAEATAGLETAAEMHAVVVGSNVI